MVNSQFLKHTPSIGNQHPVKAKKDLVGSECVEYNKLSSDMKLNKGIEDLQNHERYTHLQV